MARVFEGKLGAAGLRFGIAASRFNSLITTRLVDGALDALRRSGADESKIDLAWAPGAFELPQVARRLVESGRYDAVIVLGAVIRGGTPHFEYIAAEVAKGTAQVALQGKVPVAFGVLTTDSIEQAVERAGAKAGNKGFEAAMAAIETANLVRELDAAS